MNGWGAMSIVQRIVMPVTLAASAVLLAISMVRQMVPGSKQVFAPTVLLVAIPFVLIMVIACMFRPLQAFFATGGMCLKNGLKSSIPAAFLLWMILRRGAILYPKLVGAVVGGLAGLAGLSVLEVNCPNLNVFHILVWHAGVAAIGSLGGALLGAAVESLARWRKQKVFRASGPAR
jgi:Negative regulator of sigma F